MPIPTKILTVLEQAGFEAYYVGGCVRDTLLQRPNHDWDITTSAHPEQVMALFDKVVPTGLKHGTVTVFLDDEESEVTTFRKDGQYHDGRRPESVEFIGSLREDLIRRDFTVNAIAMDVRGTLYDYAGGQEDLAKKIIRCVGVAETRFSEDALRMLRAFRFSAQLGFMIEPGTRWAIGYCAPLCSSLSVERVRDEVEKTLYSPRPRVLERMLSSGILSGVGLERSADLHWLERLPADLSRWAALRVLLPEVDPTALRLPAKQSQLIVQAAEAYRPDLDLQQLKKIISEYDWQVAELVAVMAEKHELFDAVRESGDCVRISDLAVGGKDLDWLRGEEIGQTLHRLLSHVLLHPEDNRKEVLLTLAKTPAR